MVYSSSEQNQQTGCLSNYDCKSGRICKNYVCVYSSSEQNQKTGCLSNYDCKSGRICIDKKCVLNSSQIKLLKLQKNHLKMFWVYVLLDILA
jgi:hypothetical protein